MRNYEASIFSNECHKKLVFTTKWKMNFNLIFMETMVLFIERNIITTITTDSTINDFVQKR